FIPKRSGDDVQPPVLVEVGVVRPFAIELVRQLDLLERGSGRLRGRYRAHHTHHSGGQDHASHSCTSEEHLQERIGLRFWAMKPKRPQQYTSASSVPPPVGLPAVSSARDWQTGTNPVQRSTNRIAILPV